MGLVIDHAPWITPWSDVGDTLPHEVSLWRVALDHPESSRQGLDGLTASECARAGRFVFASDRDRFISAHLALRAVLRAQFGSAVAAEEFNLGEHGKPGIAGLLEQGWHFNLSHSDGVALIGLLRAPKARGVSLGVDVEVLRERNADFYDEIMGAHFTPQEQRAWRAMQVPASNLAMLRGWTRKEACLKALGSGFSVAPMALSCGLGPEPQDVEMDWQGERVRWHVVSLCAHDVVAAVAVQQQIGDGATWH